MKNKNINLNINSELLKILACPKCKSDTEIKSGQLVCKNNGCNQEFPIVDNIPILTQKTQKHIETQAKIFDREFITYERYELENWRISYIRRLFGWLELASGNRYLDIGVGGSGYTVIEASRKDIFSVGIDISFEGIKKAKYFAEIELGDSKLCNFAVTNAEYLPFKNEIFDRISVISVLEHIPNDELTIKEIARIMKPNGKVFVSVPNAYTRTNPIFWIPYYFHDKRIGHLTKMLQVLISKLYPKIKSRDSQLWWKLEEMDIKRETKSSGLQLTLIFKR